MKEKYSKTAYVYTEAKVLVAEDAALKSQIKKLELQLEDVQGRYYELNEKITDYRETAVRNGQIKSDSSIIRSDNFQRTEATLLLKQQADLHQEIEQLTSLATDQEYELEKIDQDYLAIRQRIHGIADTDDEEGSMITKAFRMLKSALKSLAEGIKNKWNDFKEWLEDQWEDSWLKELLTDNFIAEGLRKAYDQGQWLIVGGMIIGLGALAAVLFAVFGVKLAIALLLGLAIGTGAAIVTKVVHHFEERRIAAAENAYREQFIQKRADLLAKQELEKKLAQWELKELTSKAELEKLRTLCENQQSEIDEQLLTQAQTKVHGASPTFFPPNNADAQDVHAKMTRFLEKMKDSLSEEQLAEGHEISLKMASIFSTAKPSASAQVPPPLPTRAARSTAALPSFLKPAPKPEETPEFSLEDDDENEGELVYYVAVRKSV